MLEGLTWQHEQRARERLGDSWTLAAFIRCKKLPTYKELMADDEDARKKARARVSDVRQSPQQQALIVRMLHARFGGELISNG